MFEVTDDDIANLHPGDLRSLVARLARAELQAAGQSAAGVMAGGNENAADGGIDVRVSCPAEGFRPAFVPRAASGFQVKQTDMPPSEIKQEMRPGGTLRHSISALSLVDGAYIIVSGGGSVTDAALTRRESAMRAALCDEPAADRLETRFYDRNRLATWTNLYPGVAIWVRERVGKPLAGWHSIGDRAANRSSFLYDDTACLSAPGAAANGGDGPAAITVSDGIELLRNVLRSPAASARLIGLSGVGKTRLVQALFEPGISGTNLDPAIGVYGDEGETLAPSAHAMARELIALRTRAILVVDNCNPTTHRQLTEIVASSTVSLLTVEYDVRDDLPEETKVFRLEAASPELVIRWLQAQFPAVCQADRNRIAAFSDGNFRIARAIAGTIGAGETIGRLRASELIERIVHQRHAHDESLLQAAGALSLLYSIDGESTGPDSELAHLETICGIPADALYAHLATLQQRGIVQARGRWRAVLPQAIASALAARALNQLSADRLDRFAAELPVRMQQSFTRRIGYLHDVAAAQTAVERWLGDCGPFGELCAADEEKATILANIAPVRPELVLGRLARKLAGPNAADLSGLHWPIISEWTRLIKSIAYDASLFGPAADLLIKFAAAEDSDTQNPSAVGAFGELFFLRFSGTRASPAQRRDLVRKLANSRNAAEERLAAVALSNLLGIDNVSASSLHDFGARARDYGWAPADQVELDRWYTEAIELAVSLAPVLPAARVILAERFRELWRLPVCQDALERAGQTLSRQGAWIEGWLAARTTLRFDSAVLTATPDHLVRIVAQLAPTDLLDFARAVLLRSRPGSWDFADGLLGSGDETERWTEACQVAREVGQRMARDDARRQQFLPELLSSREGVRSFHFGQGLGEESADLGMIWIELLSHLRQIDRSQRVGTALDGFIWGARSRDPNFAQTALDQLACDPVVAHMLPRMQATIGLDNHGIERLRRVFATNTASAGDLLRAIDFHNDTPVPPDAFVAAVRMAIALPDGVTRSVDILYFRFARDARRGFPIDPLLIDLGRDLLSRVAITRRGPRDIALQDLVHRCIAGPDGAQIARDFAVRLREAVLAGDVSTQDIRETFGALAGTQLASALDVFVPELPTEQDERLFYHGFGFGATLDRLDPAGVRAWADRDAGSRYARLSRLLGMFTSPLGNQPQELSPIFLALLESAPDRVSFLGQVRCRIFPTGVYSSLADVLCQRRALVLTLQDSPYQEVRQWVLDQLPDIDYYTGIERQAEQMRDRAREERFE